MAQMCYNHFPFADFERAYEHSHKEAEEVFKAIIWQPLLESPSRGPGEPRGGHGEARVKEMRQAKAATERVMALERQEREDEKRRWKVEVEKEVLDRLDRQGLLRAVGARALLGDNIQFETGIDLDNGNTKDMNFKGGRGKGAEVMEKEDSATPTRGRKAQKIKTVEDATADVAAASAELVKAKKAAERREKLAGQRQKKSAEDAEKIKADRKRKRDEKKAEKDRKGVTSKA